MNHDKEKRGGRGRERKRPSDHPEAFCVIHPPEFVHDLSGVSALQFPFPSAHNQVIIFTTLISYLFPLISFCFLFFVNLPVESSNPFL